MRALPSKEVVRHIHPDIPKPSRLAKCIRATVVHWEKSPQ